MAPPPTAPPPDPFVGSSSAAAAAALPVHEQPPPLDAPGGPDAPKQPFATPPPALDEPPPTYRESVSAKPRPRPAHASTLASSPALPLDESDEPAVFRAQTSASSGRPQHQRQRTSVSSPVSVLEERELPSGWIRQFSPDHSRWYYVDTDSNKGAGRSTWNHPFFDAQFLASLTPPERILIEWENKLFTLRQKGVNVKLALEPRRVEDAREALAAEPDLVVPEPGPEPEYPPVSPAPTTDSTSSRRLSGFKRMSSRFKERRAARAQQKDKKQDKKQDKRKAKRKQQDTFAKAQARLSRAFSDARTTGVAQCVQEDVDGRDVIVLPPLPASNPYTPAVRDQYLGLIYDQSLKCIRTPNFEAANIAPGTGARQQGAALPIVTGVVGGLILGALLV